MWLSPRLSSRSASPGRALASFFWVARASRYATSASAVRFKLDRTNPRALRPLASRSRCSVTVGYSSASLRRIATDWPSSDTAWSGCFA